MYCGIRLSHQSKLTRHILSHSLESLKYRESIFHQTPLTNLIKSEQTTYVAQSVSSHEHMDLQEGIVADMEFPIATGSNEQGNLVLCKFCGKNFPDVSSLISHLPIHTGDRPFKCEYCGKAFKLRHHMKDHCRVHTDLTDFRASNGWTTKFLRRSHLAFRKVTGESGQLDKNVADKFIQKQFPQLIEGERPFRCGMCGKTFSRSTILKAHEKTHYPKYVRKFLSPSPVDKGEQPQ
uniref:CSON006285 protein n=1 Tax=Culicoides sonorensis TaxID=179676 RepID=A0A336MS81_CULSO